MLGTVLDPPNTRRIFNLTFDILSSSQIDSPFDVLVFYALTRSAQGRCLTFDKSSVRSRFFVGLTASSRMTISDNGCGNRISKCKYEVGT